MLLWCWIGLPVFPVSALCDAVTTIISMIIVTAQVAMAFFSYPCINAPIDFQWLKRHTSSMHSLSVVSKWVWKIQND